MDEKHLKKQTDLMSRDIEALLVALGKIVLVSVADAEGNITYANDKFVEVSKYSRAELLGENHRILKSHQQPQELFYDLWKTISNGKVWRGEIKNKAKDGSFYWVDTSIAPIIGEDGKPFRYVSVRFLITDKVQMRELAKSQISDLEDSKKAMLNMMEDYDLANKQLHLREAQLAEAQKAGRMGSFVFNVADRTLECTEGMFRIFGVKPVDKPSLDFFTSLLPKEDAKGSLLVLEKAIKTGKAFEIDTRSIMPDGSTRWMRTNARPNKDNSGKVIEMIGTTQDITKEREVDQMKTDFVSMASHQLLTPVALIEGYISMMLSDKKELLDKESIDYLQEAFAGSQRMNNLIKSLLTTSRIEKGAIKLSRERFDISLVVKKVTQDMSTNLNKKGLKFIIQDNRPVMVLADPSYTQEMISNLIDNAIKYTEKGTVTIAAQEEASFAKVSITDTGIGIRKANLPHIFEKFYMSENWLKTQSQSNGLGMYISKLLVEKMGGSISVESEAGKGTTFTIRLPLANGKKDITD